MAQLLEKIMQSKIYLLFLVFVSLNCQSSGREIIDSSQLKELKSKGVPVVDIRTKKEYKSGHIPGVLHINFMTGNFMKEMKNFDRNEPIIIYCAVGGRSGFAARMMLANGFKKVYDYSDGFKDWKERKEEIEK